MSGPGRGGAIERFYGRWAGLYDVVARGVPGVGAARRRAVESLDLEPGEAVVDMGCGTGANLPYLREAVGETGTVVGVDLTAGMLARARRLIDRAGWSNVHVVRGDATRPPVERADALLGTFVVGLFDDPAAALAGWVDCLGEGDRVALLDAAPRGGTGALDAAFRLFVAASAPPSRRIRYEESPAAALGDRVDTARAGLAERCDRVVDERTWRGFLRITAAEKRDG